MKLADNQQAFFALVRAGLWEGESQLSSYGKIDFYEIFRLAEEQSVVGLVAAGIEHVIDEVVPQEIALTIVGRALQLEHRNAAMNGFVARLIEKLRETDVDVILVKGQGVAQCYERPLWRASGDVDFLLNAENYTKAKSCLLPLASSVEEEDRERKHLGLVIDGWVVELHGTLHTRQLSELNKLLDDAQEDVFYGGNVRLWQNENTQIYLPSADNDIFFVFSHILQHYFGGGIGLRQICDWCRLLWTFRQQFNVSLLESRLQKAHVMTEWKVFASLAVGWLGMPPETMPLYDSSMRWKRKASIIIRFILNSGNFGSNRSLFNKRNRKSSRARKIQSLGRYVIDTIDHFLVFPVDSVKVLLVMCYKGIIGGIIK